MYENELTKHAKELFDEALEIMRMKNHDYAEQDDPLKNFRLVEASGLMSVEEAILSRLFDKMQRLVNGVKGEYSVSNEKFRDTIIDAINYLAILDFAVQKKEAEPGIPYSSDVVLVIEDELP